MHSFLAQYASEIKGSLSGWDRIRLRGTIRWLASLRGIASDWCVTGGLLKDFKNWATAKTEAINEATRKLAKHHRRPLLHLRCASRFGSGRAGASAPSNRWDHRMEPCWRRLRGEFAINGFRNRDLRADLYPRSPANAAVPLRGRARNGRT